MDARYRKPGWLTKNVLDRGVALLTRVGFDLAGARVLEVRGRSSGEWRRTPVNVLSHEGGRYLVAPRGNTQWVRNIRAGGSGRLGRGGGVEEFEATELPDAEKPPLLRAYLKKWHWEVGALFDGVDADSPEAELRRIAPNHPVFRLSPPHPG